MSGAGATAALAGDGSSPAFAAAALACLGAVDLVAAFAPRAPRLGGPIRGAYALFAKAGSEGFEPEAPELRRLLAVVAGVAAVGGWLVFGLGGAAVACVAGPAVAARTLAARNTRYRRDVDSGAADMAIALADALSGGHSLRGAIVSAAGSVAGPAGHELRRVARELELGAPTDVVLEAMRGRIGSPAIDVIVAGALMQRRAGGDLAQLLRTSARAFEDEARLLGEVRAATAQARFTGLVVVLLPLGGAALAELASPGFVGRLASSPLTGTLLGMAIALQVGAAFAIRRLARLRA